MTRSFVSLLAATRTMGLTVALVGCAASPIVESDGGEQLEADAGLMASEAPATQDDDKNEPGIDPNADLGGGSVSAPGTVNAKPDAGPDAGGARSDAGAKDSGSKDAGAAIDAAIADAGHSTSAPVDSGTTPTTTPTPARDAGQAAPKPGGCRSAADCTTSCVPIGILNCCRDNGTCGCTWAPGAYCQ